MSQMSRTAKIRLVTEHRAIDGSSGNHRRAVKGRSGAASLPQDPVLRSTPAGSGSECPPIEQAPLLVRPIPRWKRLFDILGASVGLLFGLPLMAAIATCIKCTSAGPVLFKQRRAGLGGVPFIMLKFRTMQVDAESRKKDLLHLNERPGPAFKLSNDPRVTGLGHFLRRWSFDELPQLWNILRGEMSLVGPRPLPCDEADACNAWQRRRQEVTPGLTCFWQVSDRTIASFDRWVHLDLAYIEQRSLATDLYILFATAPAILFGRGAC
jgi:lipopolysaccharide/colanic/teichoic acid biosynthesis glycosyltransferase